MSMGHIRPRRQGARNRAAAAKKLTKGELVAVLPPDSSAVGSEIGQNTYAVAKVDPNEQFAVRMEWDELRMTAAKLYGRGFRRAAIARALVEHLIAPESLARRSHETMIKQATTKLRRWEMSQEFRDLVYRHAVVELDMSTPGILIGLAGRARRGRVDAARLALEITGRHTKDDQAGQTNVTINLANVPRPE